MAQDDFNKESGYDQKAFLQLRLHQNLSKIDELNFQVAQVKPSQRFEIYECQFNLMSSVFATIYSKLTRKEKEEGVNGRAIILDLVNNLPRLKSGYNSKGSVGCFVNSQALNTFSESLIKFRFLLEEFMDAHGFNPSKENIGKAIAKQ